MKRCGVLALWIFLAALFLGGCGNQAEQLMFPENLQVNNRILTWDPVENASSYTVIVAGETFQTRECYLELYVLTVDGGLLPIEITARGDGKKYLDSSRTRVSVEIEPPVTQGMDEQGFEYTFVKSLMGYEVNRGTADLTGEVVIPDYFDGFPVKRIAKEMFLLHSDADCFSENYCNKVTVAVQLPAKLEEIGDRAFACMVRLEEIVIPDTVTTMGQYAFHGCTHLTKVVLPQNLKCLPVGCFKNTALREIELPASVETISSWAFGNEYRARLYENGALVSETHIYSDIASINIPASVRYIGHEAFYGRENLQDIVFCEIGSLNDFEEKVFHETAWYSAQQDGMLWLGDLLYAYKGIMPADTAIEIPGYAIVCGGAFAEQKNLATVVIASGVKLIGDGIFKKCTSLTEVVIHEGLRVIPDATFESTSSLESIQLPNTLEEIGGAAFQSSGLKKISLPAGVEKLGWRCFSRCINLSDVTLPDGLEYMEASVFSSCNTLQMVVIPSTVDAIDSYPFYGCSLLSHIFFRGTLAQLNALRTDLNQWHDDGAPYYFYSEEPPTEPGNYWHYVDGVPTPWE